MLWVIIGTMLLLAVMTIVVPLYREQKRLSLPILAATLVMTAMSAVIYSEIGTPDANSATAVAASSESQVPDVDAMVASLSARLQENPDDLDGWKMLGRSYFTMRNFTGSIAAFEKAVELESAQNSQTLADLGEAVLYDDQRALLGRAGELFENALALEAKNPKALFYGGMAAVERGNKDLGADRWEALLATSPPPNVQEILRQQIAELRGTSVASIESPVSASVVTVNVALGASALAADLPDTTVFVIARDPNQPSPPIAAVRRRLSELPAEINIGDSDAMIPGRVPSGFAQLEILARVSLGGQPIAASGDWFGQQVIETNSASTVDITIDQQVP
ncbi:MAG: tetratricopeptide repeat protein [Woeseiaceae bacterium]